jgi:hypothetical protein
MTSFILVSMLGKYWTPDGSTPRAVSMLVSELKRSTHDMTRRVTNTLEP